MARALERTTEAQMPGNNKLIGHRLSWVRTLIYNALPRDKSQGKQPPDIRRSKTLVLRFYQKLQNVQTVPIRGFRNAWLPAGSHEQSRDNEQTPKISILNDLLHRFRRINLGP